MVMSRLSFSRAPVKIAELKAKLAKYLRLVKSGEEVLVSEYHTPIAKIVPLRKEEVLPSVKPEKSFQSTILQLKVPHIPTPKIDVLELLYEDRQRR